MSNRMERPFLIYALLTVGSLNLANWKRNAVVSAICGALAMATVLATPSSGVTGIALVRAAFAPMDAKAETDALEIELRTNGPAEVVVNHNKMTVGGTSGWHTHPGPTLVSVKTGALTLYNADDPSCTPKVYPAGTGFVDPGGGHIHIARNEGTVDAEWFTTYILPPGEGTRLDAPNPGNCPF